MAARSSSALFSALARRATRISTPSRTAAPLRTALLSPSAKRISPSSSSIIRLAHTIPRPPPPSRPAAANNTSTSASQQPDPSTTTPEGKPVKFSDETPAAARRDQQQQQQQPAYELTFTCVPCGVRSGHRVSKQGYHHGSVLITCPSCRNRHVISDHLGIFGDRSGLTVEDLMRERGRLVKKGTLGEDGDVEFWEDGTTTSREERRGAEDVRSHTTDPDAPAADAAPGASWTKSAGRE